MIINVSEIDDYKRASLIDEDIAKQITSHLDEDILNGHKKIIFFNGSSTYIEQNSYHHDHIHNVTTSDWALTGAVRAVSENLKIKQIIMHPWAGAKTLVLDEQWQNSLILGIDENLKIVELTAHIDGVFVELYRETGQLFGIAERTSEKGHYYFHIK